MKGATLSEAVLDLINQSGRSWTRKGIAVELTKNGRKCNEKSIGVILGRLEKAGEIKKVARGLYESVVSEQYERVAQLVKLDHKEAPKLHNIRLSFIPKKIKQHYNSLSDDEKKVFCEKLGPVKEGINPICNKTIVGVSTPTLADILQRLTSVTDPDSLLYALITDEKRSKKKGKGLMQEIYDFRGHEVKLQYYGTGTIEIFINATHNPLEAPELHIFIEWIDALFLGRTGYSFKEIAPLFHITRVEFNRDGQTVASDMPYGRHSVTVQMLDEWMMKVYEKNTPEGDMHYIREEIIYQPEELSDSTETRNFLASLEAAMAGGVNTQFLIAQVQEIHKMNKAMYDAIKRDEELIRLMHYTLQHHIMEHNKDGPKQEPEPEKEDDDLPDFLTALALHEKK